MSISLIIGRHDDPHTEAVSIALKNLDRDVKCFDTFRGDSFTLNISKSNEISLNFLGTSSDQIASVWLRQKPFIPLPWWSPLQHDSERFSQNEWRNVIQTLCGFLSRANWINSPEIQRQINYKPKQLELALSVGFNIPESIITNNPDAINAFIETHKKIIYKSLSGYIFTDQSGILTTTITKENIKDNIDSIKKAPGIFQAFIEKDYEARVTVVGSRIFVAKIRTPKTGLGNVDWRHSHFEDIFEEGNIPFEVANMINKFQKISELRYGAYDFIVSPEGNWYFLECNPAGQFLWLERSLGFKISNAIAEDLCLATKQT
jgi:hypothetical protein